MSVPTVPTLARSAALLGALLLAGPGTALAGGTLTPVGSFQQPIRILDHHVDVLIQDGFARVEVSQTFFNANDVELEALYAFPVPEGACLSEMSVLAGEVEMTGEVVARDEARRIYEEEKSAGNDAGLAEKQGYQRFEFRIWPVPAGAETSTRFVYYQALAADTGSVRFLYPLQDGGTDDAAIAFWTENTVVERSFSMDVEIRSGWPIAAVRLPGLDAVAQVQDLAPGHRKVSVDMTGGSLDRDLVLYYRLADNLPGRVELIAQRDDPSRPGTFMLTVTPGLDLGPLTGGADYVFVLDTSGSMGGKIGTLARGVASALGQLDPRDRFRVVTFSRRARDLTGGWLPAQPELVAATIQRLQQLGADGSTNLHAGVKLALDDLDDDRATSMVLVTDAVANEGVVSPKAFEKLLSQYDVRVFGFLLGNGANWPLMRVVCDVSGGFYAGVSNADDIVGQLLLAKSKVTYECLHDAKLSIRGVDVFDVTDGALGKVYRGQQLVLFGRYRQGGRATVRLDATLTGEDRRYETSFEFPSVATDHPELERLWAYDRIDEIELLTDRGVIDADESEDAVRDLGVAYQLVTDETSMLVLHDEAFARHGIDRHNRDRVAAERRAQQRRSAQGPVTRRVDDSAPMFQQRAPRPTSGGGAVDVWMLLLAAAATADALRRRRSDVRERDERSARRGA